jgi:eukaryotic-like serine/threonine-protein kinase
MQGRTLLHYQVLDKIAEGGMGLVYKARDARLGRLVAIKVLPLNRLDAEHRSRFFREARAASALNHPNIITIYEVASCEGTEMIVMEYVDGDTLSALLASGPLPLPQVLACATQIADALAKAHAAGVIHRDLKPGNVMVTRDGLVKVLDFGLAKVSRSSAMHPADAAGPDLTDARVVLGTAAYMSPEQAAGEPLDARTDVFSFGVVLYEMIGGRRPFEGASTLETLRQLLASGPVNFEQLEGRAPAGLLQILGRALAKDREQRFTTMAEARDALRALQRTLEARSGAVTAVDGDAPTIDVTREAMRAREDTVGTGRGPDARSRGRRRIVALVAAAVLLAGGMAAWSLLRGGVSAPASASADASQPATSFDHYQAGQRALARHDRRPEVDRAIDEFTASIQKDAAYAPGYAGLADAYSRKHVLNPDPQWQRLALDSATRALELNADLAVAHLAMGRALLVNARPDDAAGHLARALELAPGLAAAHVSLAAVHAGRGDAAAAEAHHRTAVTVAPEDWQPLAELGAFLYKAARYGEAAEAWERCAGLVPDNATIHRQLGAAYHMLDRSDDAARAFQQALQIEPTAALYNNLGTLRFFQGRYGEAVAAFRRAVEMRANSYAYWGNLGDAHRWDPATRAEAPAAYATATRLAEDALAAAPDNLDVRAALALYRAKSGDAAGALRELTVLDQSGLPSPARLFRATVAYEIAGRRAEALETLRRALDAGYSEREIRMEPELVSLRTDRRFHALVSGSAR